MFWFKKKKKKIFGNNIEPNCAYCSLNLSKNFNVACKFYKGEDSCKKYTYDPTKREPMPLPKLKNYSQDDFLI